MTFPGTHYTREDALDLYHGAFTLQDFLHTNRRRGLRVFLSGKLTFADKSLTERYETAPFGLASEFIELSRKPTANTWIPISLTAWQTVGRLLPRLPDPVKFNQETWEWTIGRDWLDRVTSTAAYLLELVRAIHCESMPTHRFHSLACRQLSPKLRTLNISQPRAISWRARLCWKARRLPARC